MANSNNKVKDNKTIFAIIGVVAVVLILVLIFVVGGGGGKSSSTSNNLNNNQAVVKKDNLEISLSNGNIKIITFDGSLSKSWSSNKSSAFLEYLLENGSRIPIQGGYVVTIFIDGELVTLYLNPDDEFINAVIDDVTDSGGGGDDDDEEDIGDYFDDDTPTPTPTPTGGQGGGGDDDDEEVGGPGEDYGHPECLYWRLSYCAVPIPTPSPTPEPPVQEGVFLESDCDAWNELGIGSTIIGDTVCLE